MITGKLECWKLLTSGQENKLAILHLKSSSTHKFTSYHYHRPNIMKTSRQLALQDQKASYLILFLKMRGNKVLASKIIRDSFLGSNVIIRWSEEENINALVIGLANKLSPSPEFQLKTTKFYGM